MMREGESSDAAFAAALDAARTRRPTAEEVLVLLRLAMADGARLEELCAAACEVRDRELAGRVEVEAAFNSVVPCRLRPLCRYCPYWRDPDQELMTIEDILENVRYLRERTDIRQFHLSGGSERGEGDGGIVSIVEAIRSAGFEDMDIVVNCGASFSDAELRRLAQLRVKRVFSVFETTNPQVFAETKPGDDLDEKMRFARRIAAAGMEVGSGLMAGLGPHEHACADYAKALFDLAAIPNLACVYVSKFRHAARIPMNGHPECSLSEARALVAAARLVLRDVHIRAAAGWGADEGAAAADAGAGSVTVACSFSKGTGHWRRPEDA